MFGRQTQLAWGSPAQYCKFCFYSIYIDLYTYKTLWFPSWISWDPLIRWSASCSAAGATVLNRVWYRGIYHRQHQEGDASMQYTGMGGEARRTRWRTIFMDKTSFYIYILYFQYVIVRLGSCVVDIFLFLQIELRCILSYSTESWCCTGFGNCVFLPWNHSTQWSNVLLEWSS